MQWGEEDWVILVGGVSAEQSQAAVIQEEEAVVGILHTKGGVCNMAVLMPITLIHSGFQPLSTETPYQDEQHHHEGAKCSNMEASGGTF